MAVDRAADLDDRRLEVPTDGITWDEVCQCAIVKSWIGHHLTW